MSCRILVVDDELEIRRIMQMHLRRKGYEVETAGGTSEATAMLQSERPYDLVVCDFRMPDGNGVEVFQQLRGSTGFILISGFADMDESKLKELGIKEIVAKPVCMEHLLIKIKASLPS